MSRRMSNFHLNISGISDFLFPLTSFTQQHYYTAININLKKKNFDSSSENTVS